MEHTTNYSLPQWEASDRVTRGDMNDAMSAIDTALGAKREIVFGKYTGNGSYPRTIELGFTPKAVQLARTDGLTNTSSSVYGGIFAPDHPLKYNVAGANVAYAEVVEGGFQLNSGNVNTGGNGNYNLYHYLAFK